MSKDNQAISAIKGQATRLQQYLGSIDRKVSRTQALEGMARALHGRDWNTVRAQLEPAAAAHTPAQPTYWLMHEQGEMPAAVVMTIALGSAMTVSMSVSPWLAAQPLQEMVALCSGQRKGQAVRMAAQLLEALDAKGRSVEELTLAPTPQTSYAMLAWVKAFWPQQYFALAQELCHAGDCEGEDFLGYDVREDVDQPGLWVWTSEEAQADISYDSELGAQIAAVDHWLRANGGDKGRYVAGVQAGSGREERTTTTQDDVRGQPVAGRDCPDTGAPLMLGADAAALTVQQLAQITEEGKYRVDFVVAVNIWDLVEMGIDGLNDVVSEDFTGSCVGLEEIAYRTYQAAPEDALPADSTQVHIRVGAWVNFSALDD